MQVKLIDHMGTDVSVINAMLVSTEKNTLDERGLKDADRRRLNFLIRNKHASPFEHCVLTFFVECPLSVRSEWQRHRTLSYNEFSFRYSTPKELEFHTPTVEDMRRQVGKPGNYTFEPFDADESGAIIAEMEQLYATIAEAYEGWIARGLAREVARGILPMNTMTKFYATGNLRNWFNFLVLRNAEPAMKEIRVLAAQVEELVAATYPACYEAWVDNGRPQI